MTEVMTDPQEHLVGQLREQARSCAVMGSPMYGDLLNRAAEDVLDGGVSFSLLQGHILPGRGDAIALRLMEDDIYDDASGGLMRYRYITEEYSGEC